MRVSIRRVINRHVRVIPSLGFLFLSVQCRITHMRQLSAIKERLIQIAS